MSISNRHSWFFGAILVGGAVLAKPTVARASPLTRGRYLVHIMDCTGCHTPGSLAGHPQMGRFLAGSSIGFRLPEGIFFPPNLTPDRATGLGNWSRAQIARAIRTGIIPGGRRLAPVMPWRSFSYLTSRDALAIAAYLKSLPPIRHAVPGPQPVSAAARFPAMTLVIPGGKKH